MERTVLERLSQYIHILCIKYVHLAHWCLVHQKAKEQGIFRKKIYEIKAG
jgi:hypothetical protein